MDGRTIDRAAGDELAKAEGRAVERVVSATGPGNPHQLRLPGGHDVTVAAPASQSALGSPMYLTKAVPLAMPVAPFYVAQGQGGPPLGEAQCASTRSRPAERHPTSRTADRRTRLACQLPPAATRGHHSRSRRPWCGSPRRADRPRRRAGVPRADRHPIVSGTPASKIRTSSASPAAGSSVSELDHPAGRPEQHGDTSERMPGENPVQRLHGRTLPSPPLADR